MLANASKRRDTPVSVDIDPQEALARYIRDRLQQEENAYELKYGRGYQAKVARETKISTAHIANIITRGDQKVGIPTANKLATFWGTTLAKLMATAVEWARSTPPQPMLASPTRRRPNLEAAIDMMQRQGPLSDDVMAEARRMGTRDFSVGAWMILLGEMNLAEGGAGAPPEAQGRPGERRGRSSS